MLDPRELALRLGFRVAELPFQDTGKDAIFRRTMHHVNAARQTRKDDQALVPRAEDHDIPWQAWASGCSGNRHL